MNKSYFYLVMKTHELEVPYTAKLRRVRVLLPKNYETDTDRSYPVVYFHDGQNVLYSKEAFSGYSWKIIPTLKRNPYRTLSDRQHTAMIGSSLGGNITQFMGLDYKDQIGCLGVFSSANWLHQDAFDRYMDRQKLDSDQRVYIYVGTEEADDTDKTLMAGNIKQAYIDSSLSYYHDLIARGVDLENIKIHIQSGAEHNEEAWAENLPDCLRFFAERWD